MAVARGHLISRLSTLLDHSSTVAAVRRFVEHLNREWTALFSFLFDLDIEATNYRAEHAIRWAVVTCKMCGGNRTTRGAVTQYVLASVLRTARQRGLDRHAVFVAMLRAPTLLASPAFQTRAGPHRPR
jgi:transposase